VVATDIRSASGLEVHVLEASDDAIDGNYDDESDQQLAVRP
jgi:hypothetical protein